MLVALRRVLKEAHRLDLMVQDYTKAVDLPSIRETKNLRGRALESDEIAALDACNSQSPIDIRDAALIVILRGGYDELKWSNWNFLISSSAPVLWRFVRKGVQFICQNQRLSEEWLDIRGFEPGPLLFVKWTD